MKSFLISVLVAIAVMIVFYYSLRNSIDDKCKQLHGENWHVISGGTWNFLCQNDKYDIKGFN